MKSSEDEKLAELMMFFWSRTHPPLYTPVFVASILNHGIQSASLALKTVVGVVLSLIVVYQT